MKSQIIPMTCKENNPTKHQSFMSKRLSIVVVQTEGQIDMETKHIPSSAQHGNNLKVSVDMVVIGLVKI